MKPLKLLKKHCTFNSPYEVYVLFGISRKKENNCTNTQEKVFREVIKRPEELEKKYQRLKKSVLAYRDENGEGRKFYIYVSVNPRDTRKAFFRLQNEMVSMNEELSRQIDISNRLNRIDRYWYSCLMRPTSRAGRGRFLFDIDTKEKSMLKSIEDDKTLFTNIILKQETKNGWHYVSEPFDRRLGKGFTFMEIKTDSLLFVEWVDNVKIGEVFGMDVKIDEEIEGVELRNEHGSYRVSNGPTTEEPED